MQIDARTPCRWVSAGVSAGALVVAAYTGCAPDLDTLAAGNGPGAGGSGGSATNGGNGGSETGGSKSQGGAGGSSGSGGSASGGSSGGAMGGSGPSNGGSQSAGGNGGTDTTMGNAGAAGAMCSDDDRTSCSGDCVDLDVGLPDGSTVVHCGDCDIRCSLSHASEAQCDAGVCEPTCETGFRDCNSEAVSDGCETDITTSSDCGACGYACSDWGASEVVCEASLCVPTCAPHLANCNADAELSQDDGCETYLDSLTACQPDCDTEPVSCASDKVCNAGACVDPDGIVVMSIPFTEARQTQRYSDLFAFGTDLSGTLFSVRLYAPGATAGQLVIYFSDQDFDFGGGGTFPLTMFADGWMEITFPVGAYTGNYDPSALAQLNFEFQAGTSGPWEPEPVVIYMDSIRSDNAAINDTFDNDLGKVVGSGILVVEGSTLGWTAALPPDG